MPPVFTPLYDIRLYLSGSRCRRFHFFPTILMETQSGPEDSGVIVPNELLDHNQALKQQLAQLSDQYGIRLKAYLPKE